MHSRIVDILQNTETVDITTTGRRSGHPRRIEIWMYEVDGRFVITGTPGPRDWYANVVANPRMTVHLPGGPDVEFVASTVTDPEFRRRVLSVDKTAWYRSQTTLEDLVGNSPMVELSLLGATD